jgi:hypothetical protein
MYAREHVELGYEGTMRCLEQARQWDLSGTVSKGGVIVFPHAGVADCGHQIGAAVHACLDSGADKVVVISVLHAFTDGMQDARVNVANGADPSNYKYWGIQGTGIPGERQEWQYDHVLISWRHSCPERRCVRGPVSAPGCAGARASDRSTRRDRRRSRQQRRFWAWRHSPAS